MITAEQNFEIGQKIKRPIIFSLLLLFLVLTLFHYHEVYVKNHLSLHEFLKDPTRYSEHLDSVMGPYGGSFDDGFYLIYNKEPLKVYYNQPYTPPMYGEVLVYGVVRTDRTIAAIAVHNYNYNYFLYILSGITGLFVIVVFLKDWKFTRRGLEDA